MQIIPSLTGYNIEKGRDLNLKIYVVTLES